MANTNAFSVINNTPIHLINEQALMLHLSDNDIESGKLISQDDVDKNDIDWLNFIKKELFKSTNKT